MYNIYITWKHYFKNRENLSRLIKFFKILNVDEIEFGSWNYLFKPLIFFKKKKKLY